MVIRGEDLLRSAYIGLKDKRRELMNIYGDDCSIPEAYTALARVWLEVLQGFLGNPGVKGQPASYPQWLGRRCANVRRAGS